MISRTQFTALVCLLLFAATSFAEDTTSKPEKKATDKVPQLFDGKTLKNWEITDFGGQGDVRVKDGMIILDQGEPITGIHWKGDKLPSKNYELTFEAQRIDGTDFFCAVTFPVQENLCSLVLGGWGGGVVGLSSIDGFDASENETTDYYSFDAKKWYKVRLRVTDTMIEGWLDGDKIANVDYSDKRIGVRIEMELCKPLGFASFQTVGGLRNLKMKTVTAEEIAKEAKALKAAEDAKTSEKEQE